MVSRYYDQGWTWIVTTPDGRFDTNNLEEIKGLHWIMPDDPLTPLPIEAFMKDYYEPRLLSRILFGEQFPPVRPLMSLNRVQPKVEIETVTTDPGKPGRLLVPASHGDRKMGESGEALRRQGGIAPVRCFYWARNAAAVQSSGAL